MEKPDHSAPKAGVRFSAPLAEIAALRPNGLRRCFRSGFQFGVTGFRCGERFVVRNQCLLRVGQAVISAPCFGDLCFTYIRVFHRTDGVDLCNDRVGCGLIGCRLFRRSIEFRIAGPAAVSVS